MSAHPDTGVGELAVRDWDAERRARGIDSVLDALTSGHDDDALFAELAERAAKGEPIDDELHERLSRSLTQGGGG